MFELTSICGCSSSSPLPLSGGDPFDPLGAYISIIIRVRPAAICSIVKPSPVKSWNGGCWNGGCGRGDVWLSKGESCVFESTPICGCSLPSPPPLSGGDPFDPLSASISFGGVLPPCGGGWDGIGWDGMGWDWGVGEGARVRGRERRDGIGWDGMGGWGGMGWGGDGSGMGMGWDGMGWDGPAGSAVIAKLRLCGAPSGHLCSALFSLVHRGR